MLPLIALACLFSLGHAFQLDPSQFVLASGLACELAKCLKGICVNSSTFPFYECDCDAGWKTPSGISWLPCIVPNCTFDLTCANTSKSSHVAPPPVFPPLGGAFDICSLPVCGNGECIHNRSTTDDQYICKCDDGFSNFRNKTNGYCIHECSVGADCSNLTIGHTLGGSSHSSPPPPPPQLLSGADPSQGQGKSYPSGPIFLAATLTLMGMYI